MLILTYFFNLLFFPNLWNRIIKYYFPPIFLLTLLKVFLSHSYLIKSNPIFPQIQSVSSFIYFSIICFSYFAERILYFLTFPSIFQTRSNTIYLRKKSGDNKDFKHFTFNYYTFLVFFFFLYYFFYCLSTLLFLFLLF